MGNRLPGGGRVLERQAVPEMILAILLAMMTGVLLWYAHECWENDEEQEALAFLAAALFTTVVGIARLLGRV